MTKVAKFDDGVNMDDYNKHGSITISYGMPKSASTFAWMLLKDFLITAGRSVVTLSNEAKGNRSIEDYVTDVDSARLSIIKDEASGGDVVLKTHSISNLFSDCTNVFPDSYIFVQHRDPREIVLSLIDHGNRSRERGIQDFAECLDVDSSLLVVDHAMNSFFSWASKPNAHLISYEQLCFNTKGTILRLKKIYGIDNVDAEKLISKYGDKSLIIQFNKGVRNRWENEMSDADSMKILDRYSKYYKFVEEMV